MAKRWPFRSFAKLGAGSKRALILAEGLLIYLSSEQVGELATDLHAQPSFERWVIDHANPRLLKMTMKSWGASVAADLWS